MSPFVEADPVSASYPAEALSVCLARRLTRRTCTEWGLGGLCGDAQTVVSELVTNAVRHAGTPVQLTLSRIGDGLRVQVRDGSAVPARPRPSDPFDASGRGLQLVAALTTRWSTSRRESGKLVTADLHPGQPDRQSGSPDPGDG
jgi:anti-sigma regulatory factor (Ser/Thr protein kinase)